MSGYQDEDYEIPLRDQRYFGSGIKRKRVPFVPAKPQGDADASQLDSRGRGSAVSDTYLSIVLKGRDQHRQDPSSPGIRSQGPHVSPDEGSTCSVCRLPVTNLEEDKESTHVGSISHQVCLPHHHPPSALNRERKGLVMMQSQGWDPDLRQGLGAAGEGMLHPVRPSEKLDRRGLGHKDASNQGAGSKRPIKDPVRRLDAGKMRKLEAEERRKDQRMRNLFYREEDIDRYLGGG